MITQRSKKWTMRMALLACALFVGVVYSVQFTASASAAETVANCDELPSDFSAIYSGAHCQGLFVELGSEGFIDLSTTIVSANSASSIHLAPGTSVRVHSTTDGSGHFACLNETKRDFAFESFWRGITGTLDNRINSLIFFNDDKCGWPVQPLLYNPTSALTETTIFSVSWQEVFAGSYVVELEGLTNTISSGVKIETNWVLGPLSPGQYKWKVQGEVFGIKSEWSTFETFTVTQSTSPEPDLNCDNQNFSFVVMFEEANCRGAYQGFDTPGFYFLNGNPVQYDDLASSVIVPIGKSARLYQNATRQGGYICVNETKRDFAVEQYWHNAGSLDNSVSAIEIFADGMCGWPQSPMLLKPREPITTGQTISLAWEQVYAGSYRAELYGPDGNLINQTGAYISTTWQVGPLSAGVHSFKVQGEVFGILSEWTQPMTFTVTAAPVDPGPGPDPEDDCADLNGPNLMVFPLKDCQGNPLTILKPGNYTLVGTGMENAVGSIYVPANTSVRVYQNDAQGGLVSFYAETMWDLANDVFWQSDVKVGSAMSSLTWYNNTTGTMAIYLPLVAR